MGKHLFLDTTQTNKAFWAWTSVKSSARVLEAHPCVNITEWRNKCCTLPAPCCPLMDLSHTRDGDVLSESGQESCLYTSCFGASRLMSDFYLMFLDFSLLQNARRKHWFSTHPSHELCWGGWGSSHFSLILMHKTSLCNGNISHNVYSPSWIKMDMSMCCHSSWRNIFLLKNLGKKKSTIL